MSNRAILVDPMPNSSNDNVMNCIADSEENLGSERVKVVVESHSGDFKESAGVALLSVRI